MRWVPVHGWSSSGHRNTQATVQRNCEVEQTILGKEKVIEDDRGSAGVCCTDTVKKVQSSSNAAIVKEMHRRPTLVDEMFANWEITQRLHECGVDSPSTNSFSTPIPSSCTSIVHRKIQIYP